MANSQIPNILTQPRNPKPTIRWGRRSALGLQTRAHVPASHHRTQAITNIPNRTYHQTTPNPPRKYCPSAPCLVAACSYFIYSLAISIPCSISCKIGLRKKHTHSPTRLRHPKRPPFLCRSVRPNPTHTLMSCCAHSIPSRPPFRGARV